MDKLVIGQHYKTALIHVTRLVFAAAGFLLIMVELTQHALLKLFELIDFFRKQANAVEFLKGAPQQPQP